ncbi:MAG: hypothetical protein ABWZ78_03585, partial [Burkholderiaceae bacterium]
STSSSFLEFLLFRPAPFAPSRLPAGPFGRFGLALAGNDSTLSQRRLAVRTSHCSAGERCACDYSGIGILPR